MLTPDEITPKTAEITARYRQADWKGPFEIIGADW
jgi:hypothetical protein